MPSRFHEVTDAATLAEQRWAYERRLERRSIADMVELAKLPRERGGLGKAMSTTTMSRRVRHYVADMREVETETRDDYRHRELANLDTQQRAFAELTNRVDIESSILRARRLTGLSLSIDEVWQDVPEAIVMRDERVVLNALAGMVRVAESRRKLLGLDAPTESRVEVVSNDAVTAELNEMLARAGRPPIPAPRT
jgi:hypothetical protein